VEEKPKVEEKVPEAKPVETKAAESSSGQPPQGGKKQPTPKGGAKPKQQRMQCFNSLFCAFVL
jgi:hypothetical protein